MIKNNLPKLILLKFFSAPIQTILTANILFATTISWATSEEFLFNNYGLRPQPILEKEARFTPEIQTVVDAILSDPEVQFFKRAGWVKVESGGGVFAILRISITNPANPHKRTMGLLISSDTTNQYRVSTFTPFGPRPGRTIRGATSLSEAARDEWGTLKEARLCREWLTVAKEQIIQGSISPNDRQITGMNAQEISDVLDLLTSEARVAVNTILSDPEMKTFQQIGWLNVEPQNYFQGHKPDPRYFPTATVRVLIINPANTSERNMGILISNNRDAKDLYRVSTFTPFGPRPGRTICGAKFLVEAVQGELSNLKESKPCRDWFAAARMEPAPFLGIAGSPQYGLNSI